LVEAAEVAGGFAAGVLAAGVVAIAVAIGLEGAVVVVPEPQPERIIENNRRPAIVIKNIFRIVRTPLFFIFLLKSILIVNFFRLDFYLIVFAGKHTLYKYDRLVDNSEI
jgi:hypothetical protein